MVAVNGTNGAKRAVAIHGYLVRYVVKFLYKTYSQLSVTGIKVYLVL